VLQLDGWVLEEAPRCQWAVFPGEVDFGGEFFRGPWWWGLALSIPGSQDVEGLFLGEVVASDDFAEELVEGGFVAMLFDVELGLLNTLGVAVRIRG
jgi:hypothetical protein